MSRTVLDLTGVTGGAQAYTGSWGTVSAADAYGGSYLSSTVNGATCTITVAAGVTGVLLTGTFLSTDYRPTVAVDGGTPQVWRQYNYTTSAAATYSVGGNPYTVPWYQAAFPPIRFTNTAVSHTIVVTAANGGCSLDSVEFFTAEAATAGKLLVGGDSRAFGTDLPSYTTQRWGAILAGMLAMTETNRGIGGTALIYDNVGVGGSAGWKRNAAVGTGSAATGTFSGGQVTGLTAITGGSGWFGEPWVTFTGGGGSGADGFASVNSAGAVTGYSSADPGTGYTSAPAAVFSNHFWAEKPALFAYQMGINDFNGFGGTDPGGALGFAREQTKQRLREVVWRMALNVPATPLILVSMTPANDAANANRFLWGADQAAVIAEESVSNLYYANVWDTVMNSGFPTNLYSNIHPKETVTPLMASEIYRQLRQQQAIGGVRPGW